MLHNIMISIGALNEAISDIFGALVNAFIGKNDEDIWRITEDIETPSVAGDAMRYMCDSVLDGISRDYYPDRFLGEGSHKFWHSQPCVQHASSRLLFDTILTI